MNPVILNFLKMVDCTKHYIERSKKYNFLYDLYVSDISEEKIQQLQFAIDSYIEPILSVRVVKDEDRI